VVLTNSYSSRSQSTAVTKHGIFVDGDVCKVTELFDLVACKNITKVSDFTSDEINMHDQQSPQTEQFNSFTCQSKGSKIPQNEVVLSSFSNKLVSLAHQVVSKGNGICLDLFGIGLEPRGLDLFQGNSQSTDLVIVGTTLKRWENSEVDLVFEVINRILWLTLLWWFRALAIEDHTSPRTPQTFVGSGGDYVTVLKGVGSFLQPKTVQI